jgi:putative transposase
LILEGLDREAAARRARAQTVALWRYTLVEEAMDAQLTSRQRGRVVADIAAREHVGPFGARVRVSRKTLDRWIRARRGGGFDALVPAPRRCTPRTDAAVLELALALKKENPARTAAQVRRVLAAQSGGWAPSERTLQRLFAYHELGTRPHGRAPDAFGRFEASKINEIWTADALHGPRVAGRLSYLFAIIDDRSRLLVGHQFTHREDAVRFRGVFRHAVGHHGIPNILYTDNGAPFVDESLLRTCARLSIKVTHSAPGRPMGRGKIERIFETIRHQFLVEITGTGGDPARHQVADLDELNEAFANWVNQEYHPRVHSETGQSPLQRRADGGPVTLPQPSVLRAAFVWTATRLVRKTATVDLEGNTYSVDPFLVGRKIDLHYDPFDLTAIDVYWAGKRVGPAVPQHISRHAHPKAPPENEPEPISLTGIDYIKLLADAEHADTSTRLNLAHLAEDHTTTSRPDNPDQREQEAQT